MEVGKPAVGGRIASVFLIGLCGGAALLGSVYTVIHFDKPLAVISLGVLASGVSYLLALLVKPASPAIVPGGKANAVPSEPLSDLPDTPRQIRLLRKLWGVAFWAGALSTFEVWFIASTHVTWVTVLWTVTIMAAPAAATLRILAEFRMAQLPYLIQVTEFLDEYWWWLVFWLPAALIGVQKIVH